MKKKYRTTAISVLAAAVAAVLIAACMIFTRPAAVYAANRYVTIDGTNVFYTAIRGAEITSGMETVSLEDGGTEDRHYTLFKIGDGETVSYRKSLAYSWYSGSGHLDEDGNPTGAYEKYSFSMTIGFDAIDFVRFVIEFQSQQYLDTKDDITDNFLVFEPDGETPGNVRIGVTTDIEKTVESFPVSIPAANHAKIKISFGTYENGDVKLAFNDVESDLKFTNVYYPYASYISSGDTAVTPLIFKAEFEDDEVASDGGEKTADMKLYDLNGQSFELFANDSDGVYDDAMDNAPPVICFTRTPSYVEFGKTPSFDYQLIDVLATSPRATTCFYVLSGEQYEATDFSYMQTEYDADEDEEEGEEGEEGGEGEEAPKYENPFIKVSSGSDIRVLRDENTFVPAQYLQGGAEYSEDHVVYGLIKVYFEISDVTGSSAKTDKVFADWYAESAAVVNLYDLKNDLITEGDARKTGNFLKIIDGKDGATYAKTADTEAADGDYLAAYKQTVEGIRQTYQARIDEAIENLEDKKLYAGGDNSFYLPAYDMLADEGMFGDVYCNIYDYKYSIYYKGNSSGSNTSLAYNKLSIPLNDADTSYRFTVFVTDAFGNSMRYPDKDGEGALVWKEITTDDIWDEDFYDLLPFFEFSVSYSKATAKNPESLPVAYVGTSYSGVSFNVKNSASTSTTSYDLFIFDRNAAYNDLGIELTYAQFGENFDKLFNDSYIDGAVTRKYFKTVKPSADLKESDSDYDLFKAINWSATAVSFTPQSAEDFYIVRLTLTDNRSQDKDTYFATVAASIQANSLKGETEWLQNNLTAVILLSIAGVLLIAFVLLLVIKPKDKGDIDEIYENSKKGGKGKKAEKENKK